MFFCFNLKNTYFSDPSYFILHPALPSYYSIHWLYLLWNYSWIINKWMNNYCWWWIILMRKKSETLSSCSSWGKNALKLLLLYWYDMEAGIRLSLKRFPDSNISSLIRVGWCEEPKTCLIIPMDRHLDNCHMMTKSLKVGCLPHAVGKQLSIPLINLEGHGC